MFRHVTATLYLGPWYVWLSANRKTRGWGAHKMDAFNHWGGSVDLAK